MSFSRVRVRSFEGLRVLSNEGVGGVRAVLSDEEVDNDDVDKEDGEHESCGSAGS